jgi:phosphate starvation-inducible membrane PsiE
MINSILREIKWNFIYICQLLLIQIFLTLSLELKKFKTDWSARQYDMIDMLTMIAVLFMYFGFSNSVKRSYKIHVKKIKKDKIKQVQPST